MADFRQLAKNNPLKPRPVAIPQLDPLTEIGTQSQKPKQPKIRKTIEKPATAAQKDAKPATTPPVATDDVDIYKNKYLQKEEEKVTVTFRMFKWRNEQVDHEARDIGLKPWQIIDVGLEMYFRDKQKKQ
jgi:hypothetical protein